VRWLPVPERSSTTGDQLAADGFFASAEVVQKLNFPATPGAMSVGAADGRA
jgi:hypothetical protein